MLSNVKKKDMPLIAISLVAILFIAATLSLFPQQSAQVANTLFNGVTRMLGSAVQILVDGDGLVVWLATSKYGNIRLGRRKSGIQHAVLAVYVYLCRTRFLHALLGRC